MDYKTLRLEVEKRIPREYWDGIIRPSDDEKESEYITKKNSDYIPLPKRIYIYGRQDGKSYDFAYEGQKWFFYALIILKFYDLMNLLPALFILSFLREYGDYFHNIDIKTIQKIDLCATGELVKNEIGLPRYRSKVLLLESRRANRLMLDMRTWGEKCLKEVMKSPELLADLIVDVVASCTEEYYFFY